MPLSNLPNDGLYITRKRKKWKFAHFDSYPNCVSANRSDDPKKAYQTIKAYFARSEREKRGKVVLEVAAGNAQFSLELARRYPQNDYIALDIKSDRLYTSAKAALNEGVNNIIFVRAHMNDLPELFEHGSVDEIWLTFPDPFPRDRSAKHRLTHQSFLQKYRTILNDKGVLRFKTDNRELFLWSLEQFVDQKWHITELSFDLHETDLPDDYKINTYYEQRYLRENKSINYCSIRW